MNRSRKSRVRCAVDLGRWISYAAAGAVTAVAAANDSEAGILFSGVLNTTLPTHPTGSVKLHTLLANSNPGAVAIGTLVHSFNSIALGPMGTVQHTYHDKFKIAPAASLNGHKGVIGLNNPGHLGGNNQNYASKLALGFNILSGPFDAVSGGPRRMRLATSYSHGPQSRNSPYAKWDGGGTGFLGFRFDTGAGIQYGWAELTITATPKVQMTLVEYAYGTVGQAITAGQTALVPEPATVGLLAMGALGVLALRGGRKGIGARIAG